MKHLTIIAAAFALFGGATAAANPQRVEIAYSIRAKGVTAGEFTYLAELSGDRYRAQATRRATGLARTLAGASQDYTYSVDGALGREGPRPVAYTHRGGRRDRVVNVAFAADGSSVTTANPVMGLGDPPATEAQRRGAIDQVTMFLALMTPADRARPCERTLRVLMDGRARFDLAMSGAGQADVNTRAYQGKAFRCRVQYTPIAGFSDPQEPAELTFLLAPLASGAFAPVRVEMPNDDLGVVVLEAKSLTVR